MVVAMAMPKSPTSHPHPVPTLHQTAPGPGMMGLKKTVYVCMYVTQAYRQECLEQVQVVGVFHGKIVVNSLVGMMLL